MTALPGRTSRIGLTVAAALLVLTTLGVAPVAAAADATVVATVLVRVPLPGVAARNLCATYRGTAGTVERCVQTPKADGATLVVSATVRADAAVPQPTVEVEQCGSGLDTGARVTVNAGADVDVHADIHASGVPSQGLTQALRPDETVEISACPVG